LSGLESPVSPALISSSSQFTISDGLNQAGAVGSIFATQTSNTQTSDGASQSSSGVGQVAASNQRARLSVVDSANQTTAATPKTTPSPAALSAGAATAPTTEIELNGKINLDGGE